MSQAVKRRVALSFLAHPDDAEFLCGGVLIRLADLGWEVHIATVANGNCGSATLGREEIAARRRKEGAAAATSIGAQYHCLEQSDLSVVCDQPTLQKAIDLFRGVGPSIVLTHPRRDYMLDHEQTHLLARGATFGYAVPNASPLPLLEGLAVPWTYYCDPTEAKDPYNGEPARTSVAIDVSEQIERKEKMLACHASQREWLRSHHGMDEYLEAMRRHSRQRGSLIGVQYAEAFTQHLGHAYPQSDLLEQLLGKDA